MIDALHDGSAAALLRWWAVLVLGTAAWFPLAARQWPGGMAWAAARGLALLATAYAAWLPATLGVPVAAAAVALPLAAAALAWGCQPNKAPAPDWRQARHDELVFAGLLLLWAVLRASRADLSGTEKFMDYGLLQASLQAGAQGGALPPPDPWFAGAAVNYYYFGHWLTAVLARLSGVPPAFAYNLMLATVPALAMAAVLALVRELLRASGLATRAACNAGGWLGALLIGFGGNLHTMAHGVLPALRSWSGGPAAAGYFYPSASRFIGEAPGAPEQLITEFPAYSFVVGDLHAHLLNLPLVLLLMMMLCSRLLYDPPAAHLQRHAAIALVLGAMAMTNAWAFPVYTLLAGLAAAAGRWQAGMRGARWLAGTLAEGLLLGAAGLLAAAPFFWRFEPFNRGFGWAETHTAARDLALLWGAPVALVAGFCATAWVASRQRPSLRLRLLRARGPAHVLALLLAVGLSCIVAAEVVVVLDIYGPAFRRTNTVFKLGYEAFTLFTVCAAVAAAGTVLLAARLPRLGKPARAGLLGGVWLACLAPLTFAGYAVVQGFGPFDRYMTLDALAGMARSRPDDRQTIDWLRSRVPPGSIVLEVDGFSYTYAGRMATATGLPTVLGWRAHEVLWRKAAQPEIEQRGIDVERIYRAEDCAAASALLDRYRIGHIVLGAYEHERLPGLDEARLLRLADAAARFGGTLVLQVRPPERRCATRHQPGTP